jgi:hypothetical protein
MCSRRIVLLLCFMSFYSLAGSKEASLKCQEVTRSDGKHVILSANDLELKIKNPRRACDSVFTYESIMLPKEKMVITSWPTDDELGVNAQRDLFVALPGGAELSYIGSIPVDAVAISADRYRNIAQVGGSIYETVYLLGDHSITLETPGKELIFSDDACIYKDQNDDVCHILTGTFDNPLCVYIHNERKVMMDLSSCSELFHSKE